MTSLSRALIVNADDFGQSAGINRGVIQAHQHGIVTSASLMVCWPAAVAAAAYACSHPALSLGLHFDIGEWVFRNGAWETLYAWTNPDDPKAIGREARLQLERFRDLVGRNPTHLDSHQHVHRHAPAHDVLAEIAFELGVPLRHFSSIRYCGDFYGQSATGEQLPDRIETTALAHVLRSVPPGVTELVCHPGYAGDVESMYQEERQIELETLCSADIRTVLQDEDIRLVSFGDAMSVCGTL